MSRWRTRLGRWASRYLLLPIILGVAIGSLIPLIETNTWWIRYLDFPRIEFVIVLLAALLLYVLIGQWRRKVGVFAIAIALAALGYNAYRLWPYMPRPKNPIGEPAAACARDAQLSVMIANVQEGNRHSAKLLDMVQRIQPDIFLAMETNRWWNRQLEPLDAVYDHQIVKNPKNAKYFGIHLFSKKELVDPQVHFFFDATTPTIVTGIRMPNRATPVQFVGLHPRPPLMWSQSSTIRDGHILKSALIAGHSSAPTIIAGDFNAVSWERVLRRAMRVGGLLDARVHRGFIPSYNAKHWYMAWPLDQMLYQPSLRLLDFKRLPAFGSDHYPMLGRFCTDPADHSRRQPPAKDSGDPAEVQTSLQAAQQYDSGRTH
ncbi:endonuclease/exonuclease/phosphatase family protein [Salinisphaera sp. SPP-AMP-43]|uniref:endonuclease/exonuclease/phosphatase family protein n=1 Tax=Salinisphaera sp. SPP-AMP-43 TaxID=3121288 RepID=UPI003C6E8AB4